MSTIELEREQQVIDLFDAAMTAAAKEYPLSVDGLPAKADVVHDRIHRRATAMFQAIARAAAMSARMGIS